MFDNLENIQNVFFGIEFPEVDFNAIFINTNTKAVYLFIDNEWKNLFTEQIEASLISLLENRQLSSSNDNNEIRDEVLLIINNFISSFDSKDIFTENIKGKIELRNLGLNKPSGSKTVLCGNNRWNDILFNLFIDNEDEIDITKNSLIGGKINDISFILFNNDSNNPFKLSSGNNYFSINDFSNNNEYLKIDSSSNTITLKSKNITLNPINTEDDIFNVNFKNVTFSKDVTINGDLKCNFNLSNVSEGVLSTFHGGLGISLHDKNGIVLIKENKSLFLEYNGNNEVLLNDCQNLVVRDSINLNSNLFSITGKFRYLNLSSDNTEGNVYNIASELVYPGFEKIINIGLGGLNDSKTSIRLGDIKSKSIIEINGQLNLNKNLLKKYRKIDLSSGIIEICPLSQSIFKIENENKNYKITIKNIPTLDEGKCLEILLVCDNVNKLIFDSNIKIKNKDSNIIKLLTFDGITWIQI